ncbi:MAG: biotin transporter BioY [Lachnospiraceae bacterium]|nr:biotin transporter BioY [Lachnospiraceae bacterium]
MQVRETGIGAVNRSRTYDVAYIGIFTALITICSWISIPAAIPFSLQTFAVFLAVSILGGKRGTLAVVVYVLLGAIGIPVFAEFTGGIGIILRSTGGYIIGFIFSALVMWLMESLFGRRIWVQGISMVLGLIACYAVGTAWFMFVYMRDTGAVGLTTVLGWCVVPFVIPDALKIVLALMLSSALKKPLAGIIGER